MNNTFIIFFTGLSGSGKTTLSNAIYNRLNNIIQIDGDVFRKGVSSDLGFSLDDRKENIRRLSEVCKLINSEMNIIVSFIAPTENIRNVFRNNFDNIIEIYISCPIETCIKRNPKKLYNKNIKNFTGISQKFEPSLKCNIEIDTSKLTIQECEDIIIKYLKDNNYIR